MNLDWATAADAEALAAAHATGFDHPWTAQAFIDLFAGPGVFGLVARDGETAVGMGLFRTVLGETEVLTIAVNPARRREGIARAIMAAAIGAALDQASEACFLEVAADNPGAEQLYRGLGFRAAGRRRDYYHRGAQGRVDALVMRLDLTSDAS